MNLNRHISFPERRFCWVDRVLTLTPGKTLIMGILNITPDSFSDGGKYNHMDAALRHLETMLACGADIIDLGAESTRPYTGAVKVSAEEELDRLLPILEKVLAVCPVPVSIDTYKATVAEAALKAGAHLINDIWGLQCDPAMAAVIAAYDAPVVIMHNQQGTDYTNDIIAEITGFLRTSIAIGTAAGISAEKMIIDPGIGFGKTGAQNLLIMSRLEELQELGHPILIGTSRKRFIGEVLGLPVEERVEGTGATVALGIAKGATIVRVHDVEAMRRVALMTDAMLRGSFYAG